MEEVGRSHIWSFSSLNIWPLNGLKLQLFQLLQAASRLFLQQQARYILIAIENKPQLLLPHSTNDQTKGFATFSWHLIFFEKKLWLNEYSFLGG